MAGKTVDERYELKRGMLIHTVVSMLEVMEWHLEIENNLLNSRLEPILGDEKLYKLNQFERQSKDLFHNFQKALLDEAIKLEDNFFFPGIAPETYK